MYRIEHDGEECCPCERIGRYDCPIHRYIADEGQLTVVFHAADFGTLQEIVGELREQYPPVDVQRLLQPPLEGTPEDRVFVNRGRLTERQLEVSPLAHDGPRAVFDPHLLRLPRLGTDDLSAAGLRPRQRETPVPLLQSELPHRRRRRERLGDRSTAASSPAAPSKR